MTVFHHLNHMVTSMLKSIAFVKNINNRNNNLLFQYMISLQGFHSKPQNCVKLHFEYWHYLKCLLDVLESNVDLWMIYETTFTGLN